MTKTFLHGRLVSSNFSPQNYSLAFILIFTCFSSILIAQEAISYHPLGEWRIITSDFGYRDNPFGKSREWEFHKGIDLDVDIGDSVFAWRSGVVSFTGSNKTSGNMIQITHEGGFISKYHHLSSIDVSKGDFIAGGQFIGRAGNTGRVTGPHLHFTLILNNEAIDPEPYLRKVHLANSPNQHILVEKPVTIYKHLSLRTFPVNGEVTIDGEKMGNSPLDTKLSYGEHFIEIDAGDAYEPFVARLWVDQKFNRIYTARLQPKNNSNRAKTGAIGQ